MPRRKAKIAVGLVLALGIVCFLFFWVFPRVGGKSEPEWNPVRGTPDSPLSRTEMVATKEDPISGGKNVVWCATLQISWDRLRNDLFGGRLEIQGSKEKSERLNASPFDTGSLDVRDYYVAAGWVKDGIIGKVRDDLSRRFPGESDPLPEASEFAAVSYAFLKIGLKFPIPYFESREPLQFRDGSGRETPVTSFGIRHEDDYAYGSMRRQVMPLYASNDGDGGPQKEFVLDLYDESDPYQLLVARIDFKGTLGETLRDMDERIRTWKGYHKFFGTNEVFLVPNIQLDLSHRFRDLEDSVIGLVQQRIQFRLDRSGAEVKSEAKHHVKPIPRWFICDRPFLVVIRNRSTRAAIFALWVENAEVLQSWR